MKFLFQIIFIFLFGEMLSQCPPQFTISIPSLTPTCSNPTLLISTTASSSNIAFFWQGTDIFQSVTGNSISLPTYSMGWFPENVPTCYSYSLTATNTLLSCSSSTAFTLCPNFKMPLAAPSIIGTQSVICKNNVLLGSSNSTVTSGAIRASIQNTYWFPPDLPPILSPTLSVSEPGVYTLQVQDSYNGCLGSQTINVGDSRPQFNLQGTAPTNSLNCNGSLTVTPLSPGNYTLSVNQGSVTGGTVTNLCYGWAKVCMTYTDTGCFKCDSLMINAATGIEDIESENSFGVFPNPSLGNFQIQFFSQENYTLLVKNLEGKIIFRETFPAIQKENTIHIEKPGFYFLDVKYGEKTIRRKIVVMK